MPELGQKEEPNNIILTCERCGAFITRVCLFSQDWSAKAQLESGLEMMRIHNEIAHKLQRPG